MLKKIIILILLAATSILATLFSGYGVVQAATATLNPNADVSGQMQWTPSSGTNHTALVTDSDDLTYVSAGTSPEAVPMTGYYDTFDMTTEVGAALVSQITVNFRADGNDRWPPTMRVDISNDGVNWTSSTNQSIGALWNNYSKTFSVSWNQTQLNNFRVRVVYTVDSAPFTQVSVSKIWADVTYTAVTAPTVTTSAATPITSTSAAGNGNITATGGANATTRGFKYSAGASCTDANTVSETGSFGTGAFSLTMSGLTATTQYSYRAFATNSGGTGYGSCVQFTTAAPAAPTNVYGWAWSENIGWISFNRTNCDANNDGLSDGTPAGCPSAGTPIANYGVHICTSDTDSLCDGVTAPKTGKFIGYAWSEHIGWIHFAPAGPYPTTTPNYPYSACVDLPSITTEPCNGIGSYNVAGWARVLSTVGVDDGWDGWIKLRGTNYGVSIDTGPTPDEFRGWAWSDVVIGWISFNHLNCDPNNDGVSDGIGACPPAGTPIPDYKVMTNLNTSPTATSVLFDGDVYCNILPGVGQVKFKWTYNDADGDPQSQYHLQIATNGAFTNLVVDSINSQTVSPGGTGTSAVQVKTNPTSDTDDLDIGYGDTYFWRLRVRECQNPPTCTEGEWSAFVNGAGPHVFSTPSHPYPWIDFSWAPQSPSVDELVQFCSVEETIYDEEGNPIGTICSPSLTFCYDADSACNSWNWTFEYGEPATSTLPNPTAKFTQIDQVDKNQVRLTVKDSDNYECYEEKDVGVALPLPEWKEIAPF